MTGHLPLGPDPGEAGQIGGMPAAFAGSVRIRRVMPGGLLGCLYELVREPGC